MLALLLACPAAAGAVEVGGRPGNNALEVRTLADFEQPGMRPIALAWRRFPADSPHGLRYDLVASGRSGSGGQALRVTYRLPEAAGAGPGDDEFDLVLPLGGLDATPYDHLRFWIRGDTVAGFAPSLEVKFLRPHPSATGQRQEAGFRVNEIGGEWRQVDIPLGQMRGIDDWRNLESFVIAVHDRDTGVRMGAYLLDDITLVKAAPEPASQDVVAAVRKLAWEEALGGEAAARPHLKARLNGWPTQFLIDHKTLPQEDRAFLARLAADTWRGLDALTDREHGLPLDRIHFGHSSLDVGVARIGDYTSVTNIGLHLLAIVAAFELRLIDEAQALARAAVTLGTLEQLENFQGFYYNYYNTTTLERTSEFISFVDSAWLTAGLMVLRQTFPALAERSTRLIQQGNYRFFYDADWKLMSHGYYVSRNQRSTLHYGTLYAESRIGSLIAIGKGEAEPEHWFAMARTFPNELTWQSMHPENRREKDARGYHWVDGHYRWRDYRYVPSWGGSLFEALMPVLVLDEARYAPQSLGRNGAVHSEIQRRYALEDLGYPVWGMSPSSTPGVETYGEYGVKILGSLGYRDGVVTPHAAALALLMEPEEATRNLRRLAERYALYGDFGFYDAVNPMSGEVAYTYLCLNQAMILVALADHLADHAVQKRFAADPIIQNVLDLLGVESFFD